MKAKALNICYSNSKLHQKVSVQTIANHEKMRTS